MDTDILSQLVQIKWLLVLFVGVVLLSLSFRLWLELRKSGGISRVMRDSFAHEAHSLLDTGRNAELLSLARARCKEFPGDAYAFWYCAVAAHRLGDIDTALESMRKVGELQPDWRESHVEPFIRTLTQESNVVPKSSAS